jgi:hypothetical protein
VPNATGCTEGEMSMFPEALAVERGASVVWAE